MPISLNLGTRRLHFRWHFLVLTVVGCALFTSLGFWQWGRGVHRQLDWAAFELAAKSPPQPVKGARLDSLPRHTRVRVEGRYDAMHQFLLDNITRDGRSGYEILTPFQMTDGTTLLVDRGWVAFTGYRDRLPDVSVPAGQEGDLTLEGQLANLPVSGLASGRVPPASDATWPKVTGFPRNADLAAALGRPVAMPVLAVGAELKPPGFEPARNYSYAIQWWSFAGLALLLFVFLNLEKR